MKKKVTLFLWSRSTEKNRNFKVYKVPGISIQDALDLGTLWYKSTNEKYKRDYEIDYYGTNPYIGYPITDATVDSIKDLINSEENSDGC